MRLTVPFSANVAREFFANLPAAPNPNFIFFIPALDAVFSESPSYWNRFFGKYPYTRNAYLRFMLRTDFATTLIRHISA